MIESRTIWDLVLPGRFEALFSTAMTVAKIGPAGFIAEVVGSTEGLL
jgi:hypothetical protein